MAGTITHAYFSMDVYNSLNENKKDILKDYKNNLRVFAQGHDIFSFSSLKKSELFHNKKTSDFFINMIKYIKDNELYNDGEILSYLYGYICHYVLDKNIHPFVTYKTGRFNKKDKNTYKYRSVHSDMETYLDSYFIRSKENIEPGVFKSHKFALNPNKFSSSLLDLIDYTFKKTYDYDNVGIIYYKGIKKMHILYALLRNDRFKIKKAMYSTVDKITPKSFYKFRPISFHYKKGEKDKYLNLDNKKWNHPMDKNEIYTTSAIDIYNNSVKEAVDIINKLDNYFNNKKIDLKKIFNNISFSTGKDCKDKRKEKYFEF